MRPMGGPGRGPHGGGPHHEEKHRSLAEISVTVWLTPENARFLYQNNFLYIEYDGKTQRVFLCRQFPFELEWEFISVMDAEQQEIGIVKSVELFDEEQKKLLVEELRRRYYSPVIDKIISVKERYGFSYWKVHTPDGEVSFTLHDTYRSIIHAGETRIIMLDVNGNRFEIPDTSALDHKSYKKIELYL
ncbi:MAG: DUF1854 domain-containing protein [Clostridia bacterium]|nr:DUF1854 domain-containing protein [Clostridia bacterium]